MRTCVGVVLMVALVSGCRRDESGSTSVTSTAPVGPIDLHARTAAEFEDVGFFKPRDGSASERLVGLGSLIVQEAAGADAAVDRFGAVYARADSTVVVDPAAATVYVGSSVARLGEREYEQIVHVWFYASDTPGGAIRWQGMRMTFGRDGYPIVWEVLANDTERSVVFVSRSLERASGEAFGAVLAGRRFAVERSVDEQPDVVVARVLEDGPIPMGPFVYLQARTRAVTTLLCRCMAAQMSNIVVNEYYDLVELSALEGLDLSRTEPRLSVSTSAASPLVLPGDRGDARWLESALRLPPEF